MFNFYNLLQIYIANEEKGKLYLIKICKIKVLYLFTLLFKSLFYLSTDSTNTRKALTWIQAVNASLKFTFSHRTNGPWKKKKRL